MKKIIPILSVLLFICFLVYSCNKKKSDDCSAECRNGGICVNNACKCTDDWRGVSCETYYTESYTGNYVSTDFNCGQGVMTQNSSVSVDPGNRNRLLIGGLFADMTDRTHFTIPKQGSTNTQGSGTIDGAKMTLTYSGSIYTITTNCSGNFTRQ